MNVHNISLRKLTMLQFLSSRPSTPIPFRPKRSNTNSLSSVDFSPLKQEIKKDSAVPSGLDSSSHVVAHLDSTVAVANGKENGVNAHE